MDFVSCILSGSFEEQVTAFQYPIEPCFQIDYEAFYQALERMEKEYGDGIELQTLKKRLLEYEDIFRI